MEVKSIAFALVFVEEEYGLGSEEVDSDDLGSLGGGGSTSLKGTALR